MVLLTVKRAISNIPRRLNVPNDPQDADFAASQLGLVFNLNPKMLEARFATARRDRDIHARVFENRFYLAGHVIFSQGLFTRGGLANSGSGKSKDRFGLKNGSLSSRSPHRCFIYPTSSRKRSRFAGK